MARTRRLKRYRNRSRRSSESSSLKSNPPVVTELLEFVGPGFGGFAATRLLTKLATAQVVKYKPEWAKHAGAIASLGSLAAAWYGAHRVKMIEKWSMPITVGAAIAAIQSLIQLYVPKLGWLIADASPDQSLLATPSAGANPSSPTVQQMLATGRLAPTDEDPDWYQYDDKFDAGLYANEQRPPGSKSSHAAKVEKEEDLLADLNLDGGMGAGIFAN